MPPFGSEDQFDDGAEDDLRAELERNFGRAESGELTADNAGSLPIDPPKAAKSTDNTTERTPAAAATDPAAAAEASAAAPASAERARNPDGTFATKAPETAGQQPATGQQPPVGTPQAQPDAAAAAAQPWAPAPATMSEAGKQAWNGLHPEIRQHMERTQNEHRQQLNQIAEPLLPVRQAAERHGVTWQEGINRLMTAQRFLDENPSGAIMWLAQTHGVNLDALADQAAASGQQQPAQPNPINQLNTFIQPLNQRLTQLEQTRQQEVTQREQDVQNANLREINTFAASPEGKHFDKVMGEIGALMPHVRQQMPGASPREMLKAAYDRAVWANPEVRAMVEAERRQAEETQRRSQNQDRTVRSKALQVLTTHNGAGHLPPGVANGELTLEQELRQNWDAYEAQH